MLVFYNCYGKKITLKEYWNIKSVLDEKMSDGVSKGVNAK